MRPRSLLFAWLLPTLVLAQKPQPPDLNEPLSQFSLAVQALTARISPSVVRINTTRYSAQEGTGRNDVVIGRQQSIGSGVIIDPDGYILTNAHVIENAETIKVDLISASDETLRGLLSQTRVPLDATLVGLFKEGDIALIKIDKQNLPALKFAEYRNLRQGQVVFAFGSPEGLQNSVSMGVVSAIARQPDPDSPFLYIQTDTPINPGNSGGPLINARGEVVGLNTFILTQSGDNEGVGFAIPSNILSLAAHNIRKYGHVHRSSVGMGLQAITPTLAKALNLPRTSGVIVSDLAPGGPAAEAGLKLNDILLSVDGRAINGLPSMLGFFLQHGGNERIKFAVLRGDESITVEMTTLEQQDQADRLADLMDPAKDLIPSLGILGLTLDKRLQSIIGEPRLPTGVVVAARTDAEKAMTSGLQVGDIIHEVNQELVYDLDGLKSALSHFKPGDAVALFIERNGRLQYVTPEI